MIISRKGDKMSEIERVVSRKEKNNGFKRFIATVVVSAIVGCGAGVAGAELVLRQANSSLTKAKTEISLPQNIQSPSLLPKGDGSVVEVAKAVMPAVVGVNTYAKAGNLFRGGSFLPNFLPNFDEEARNEFSQISYGSGVIISEDGIIITNYHVIQNGERVSVTLFDGTQYEAEVLGYDAQSDLAVLKVEMTGLKSVPIGTSKNLQVGESVVAVGNPLSAEFSQTVTDGIISGINRKLKDDTQAFSLIQTNAAINSGNSGGALVNSLGQLIGINTAKISATGVEGIGFAIPIDEAMKIVKELIEKGKIEHAFIGFSGYVLTEEVAIQVGTKESKGVIVASVVSGGPADKAGLLPYDIIIAVNGEPVANFEDITKILSTKKPRETMKLTIVRDENKKEINVILGVKPVTPA